MKYLLPVLAAVSLSFAQWGNWGGKPIDDFARLCP